jgi:prepilin-type N-terminal cleavage/methylation domain-containing protein
MIQRKRGFSLIELLLALSVTLVLAAMMFHLFHQNERVIRNQTLIMEMQQTARIVASQIAEEIRMAGQGVPLHAAAFDVVPSEAVAVILASSNTSRIDFRAGLSNTETTTVGNGPSDFFIGLSRTVGVAATSGFAVGKFVYLSGPSATAQWVWLRGEVTFASSTTVTLTPRNAGTNETPIHFAAPQTASLEEVVSIYLSNGSIRRATAANMSDIANPVWSPANEIGRHCTELTFTYYDIYDNAVQPTTLSNRMTIARVDIRLTVEVANPLSDGTRPKYSLALRTIPRNIRAGRAS